MKIEKLYPILKSIPDTLFITSTSFEERCFTSLKRSLDSYSTRNVIIFDIKNPERRYYYEQEKHRQIIEKYVKTVCKDKTNAILCTEAEVIEGLKRFQGYLEDFQDPNSKYITIDISTFTKPFLFVVLRELTKLPGNNRIRVAYATADYTKYGRDEKGKYRGLSWGVRSSEAIPFFEGNGIYYDRKLLITFLGYEKERSEGVLKKVEPDITYWIIGVPPGFSKDKVFPSERINKKLLKLYTIDGNKFRQNAYDPFETKKILEKICRENPDHSVTISPLGTKTQALGIFLFALENPRISPKIFYATPVDYYDKYYTSRECEGVVDLHEFYLPTKIQLSTMHMLQGYYPPSKDAEWNEILEAIHKTPPPFPTVEEAMDWIRGRKE